MKCLLTNKRSQKERKSIKICRRKYNKCNYFREKKSANQPLQFSLDIAINAILSFYGEIDNEINTF